MNRTARLLMAATAALLASPGRGDATAISEPLTSAPGNVERGRAVFLDRGKGHCLLCHRVAALDAPSQGTIGPPLDGVSQRLTPAQLRLRIVDPTRLNPSTAMPAYHRVTDLHNVAATYRDRPVLTAQEVEDLIAFLGTI